MSWDLSPEPQKWRTSEIFLPVRILKSSRRIRRMGRQHLFDHKSYINVARLEYMNGEARHHNDYQLYLEESINEITPRLG